MVNNLDAAGIKPIEILLVEDNPGDARLTLEGFKDARIRNHITVVEDGIEAMAYLRHQGPYADVVLPDLVLLDLNMPKKGGREVLADMKADEALQQIPVLVFTISTAEKDIMEAYHLQASAFITKPIDLDEFIRVVKSMKDFWLTVVKLPQDVRKQTYA